MSNITLAQGGGGEEFGQLVGDIRSKLQFTGQWQNMMDDGATLELPPSQEGNNPQLVFTTDAFVVSPLFFNGGDIGKIAFCGTVNDLSMMGAKPLGLSLSVIIEEGLDQKIFDKVLESINKMSIQEQIPIVTGDTKVMGKGQLDKLAITTAGVGLTQKVIKDNGVQIGDKIIVSGGLGEHGATLLAARFDYETNLQSDCKPLAKEIQSIKDLITSAKDITRGGTAAIFNEMADKSKIKFIIDETILPFKQEVTSICNILGISQYSLACEGRFVCTASKNNAEEVVKILKNFNKDATIIGEVTEGEKVILQTEVGERVLEPPRGKLVPRIC